MKVGLVQCNNYSDKNEPMVKAIALDVELLLFPELVDLVKTFDYGLMTGSGYREYTIFGKPYNSYEIVKENVLLNYRKQNMFPGYDDEHKPGNTMPFTIIDGKKTYVCICYDIRNPWTFKQMENPDLIIIPADFPRQRIHDWCRILKLRAIENKCTILGINTIGGGCSMIVNKYGDIIKEAETTGECLIVGDI